MYVIPLTSDPNQAFRCTIPIDGQNTSFDFALRYNTEAEYWVMSAADAVSGQPLVANVPLLAGEYPAANLLEQFAHLDIGMAAMIKTNPDNPCAAADGSNLGADFVLVWAGSVTQ